MQGRWIAFHTGEMIQPGGSWRHVCHVGPMCVPHVCASCVCVCVCVCAACLHRSAWRRLRGLLVDRACWWEACPHDPQQLLGASVAEGGPHLVRNLASLGSPLPWLGPHPMQEPRQEVQSEGVALAPARQLQSGGQEGARHEEATKGTKRGGAESPGEEGCDGRAGLRREERERATRAARQWCTRVRVACFVLGPHSDFVRRAVHGLRQFMGEEEGAGVGAGRDAGTPMQGEARQAEEGGQGPEAAAGHGMGAQLHSPKKVKGRRKGRAEVGKAGAGRAQGEGGEEEGGGAGSEVLEQQGRQKRRRMLRVVRQWQHVPQLGQHVKQQPRDMPQDCSQACVALSLLQQVCACVRAWMWVRVWASVCGYGYCNVGGCAH